MNYLLVPEAGPNTRVETLPNENFKILITYKVVLRSRAEKDLLHRNPDLWTGEVSSGDIGLQTSH